MLTAKSYILNKSFFVLGLFIFFNSCSPSKSTTDTDWVGLMQDSAFVRFLQIDFQQTNIPDTVIQVEFLPEISNKELFLLYKNKKDARLIYRLFNTTAEEDTSFFKKTNPLTGETICWQLLKKDNQTINLSYWYKVLNTLDSINIYQMQNTLNSFALGGTTTLFSIYTLNQRNYIVRHYHNDTTNKVVKLFRKLNN